VEAAAAGSWPKYSHVQHCMKTFGASGKGGDLFKHFGFTDEKVAAKAKKVAEFYEGKAVPDLFNRPTFDDEVASH